MAETEIHGRLARVLALQPAQRLFSDDTRSIDRAAYVIHT